VTVPKKIQFHAMLSSLPDGFQRLLAEMPRREAL